MMRAMIGTLRSALVAFVFLLAQEGGVVAAPEEAPAPGAPAAGICSPESFGDAVDAAAASLRTFNAEAQPKLKDKLAALRVKKGWDEAGYEEKGLDLLFDERIAAMDAKSGELLTQIDTLGRPEAKAGAPCADLAKLKASGDELLAVMKAKSEYLMAKIDVELGQAGGPPAASAEILEKPAGPPAQQPATKPPPKEARVVAPAAPPQAKDKPLPWQTTTTPHGPQVTELAPPPDAPYVLPPDSFATSDDGYTIEEIRDATQGFFGTISTNLATVIEHAFKQAGRPTGYVLGTEGGGALLAGLRYGSGTLYLRSGGKEQVYWHGPSVGYDFGAEGSRTLFLIYRLRDAPHIYRMFTGIDGTAYFVGGVGMTLLKGGDVIMAPIRSGIGLRLGASIGYVRFTPTPTWNPF